MKSVYFKKLEAGGDPSAIARQLLEHLVETEHIPLASKIPLKVHFGEAGNRTYLHAETYAGILDFLRERKIESAYMETSVLYGGERFTRAKHLKLALRHGFDQLPVEIADGENGEESVSVPIEGKYFKTASVAKALAESEQVIVLSHFKGHALAGFGGAIKQLSMGFASKGGKMAMHSGVKPHIRNWKCKRCKLCLKRCNAQAITIGEKSWIDPSKCIGCGACFSICPHKAVAGSVFAILWNAVFQRNSFREKLVEYAYAAHKGKRHIYLSFVMNVTGGCDCEPRPMWKCVDDIGVFASTDPVSIDAACYDAVSKAGKKFKGREQLEYAEQMGLGSTDYQLIEL